jgi:hypothetical protein
LKTDDNGVWQEQIRQEDTATRQTVVASPGIIPKFKEGVPINPTNAARGEAVIVAP